MKSSEINKIYFGDVDSLNLFNSNRRDFIKRLGSGLIIAFTIGKYDAFSMNDTLNEASDPADFNAYLRIHEDGKISCYTGKIEMGQDITTSLAQVLAEELEVSLSQIEMVMGDTDLCPYDAGTWGSLTTRFFDPVLRAAAVEARRELIKLASLQLQVQEDELVISNGYVHKISDKVVKLSYAELTKGKKIVKTISSPPIFKKPSTYKTVGTPLNATNAILKVTGKAKYSADIKLPGMLYASISRPPAHGSKLVSVNTTDAEKIDGVKIVIIDDLIAALHSNPETALIAQQKIKAVWEANQIDVNDKNIFNYLIQNAAETNVVETKGNLTDGFNQSDYIGELDYYDGYKSHAPMETHTATVQFNNDKLIVWASTQTPFGTRQELSRKLDLLLEKVHIKQVLLGGGFGGKIYGQQAVEAALISRKAGVPIQLAWSRKEEFMFNMFRPAAVMQIRAGVKKDGKITAWDFKIYCAGNRGVTDFYGIDNLRTSLYDKRNIHPFGVGAWRAPGNNSTTFARESHIDVLAEKVGMDPLAFRMKNISDPKMAKTLELAAKAFGYKTAITGKNKGCGIALGVDAGTYVALIAEVSVDDYGVVTPLRMVCAQDMGQVVNPHGAKVQTVGGLTMGLGYALYEDIEFDGGEVKTTNFHQYEITRFAVTPKIDAVFIDDMESPPQGGGEPAIICVGGAIANAVFHASGARVTQMPITPERIKIALKKG